MSPIQKGSHVWDLAMDFGKPFIPHIEMYEPSTLATQSSPYGTRYFISIVTLPDESRCMYFALHENHDKSLEVHGQGFDICNQSFDRFSSLVMKKVGVDLNDGVHYEKRILNDQLGECLFRKYYGKHGKKSGKVKPRQQEKVAPCHSEWSDLFH